MVSSIVLGNFFSSGGKTVLGGVGGSGLDTAGLIDALVQARSLTLNKLQDRVTLNESKATALVEFKTLLTKFKDASDLLRNVPGFGKAASNAFDYVTASVTSNTSVAGSDYLSVSAVPGTAAQSFTINKITQLATAKIQTTDSFSISTADDEVVSSAPVGYQFFDGSFTFKGATITLEDGDSLNEVAAKFNAVKSTTGVFATVVKVNDGDFKLQFTATATGEDADFDVTPGGGDMVDTDGVFTNITGIAPLQDANNAEFQFNGEDIIRQGNSITDVVSGITLNLLQATPDPDTTDLTVSIKSDTSVAKNAIVNFLSAYNDMRIFAARQGELDNDGNPVEGAVLGNNTTLRSAINGMGSEITRIVNGLSSTVLNRLSDLGITTTDLQKTEENPFVRNILTLDEAKLDSALSSKFEEARKVFEFGFVSDNPNLVVFTRTNALAANEFTLTITPGSSIYQASYTDSSGSHTIDLTATAITGGYRLEGQAGTALEGLVLLYTSTADATIEVTATQGIGERLYNFLNDTVLNSFTGTLTAEVNALADSNTRTESEIARQQEAIDRYREQLLAKFGALESTISSVNTLLASLSAQSDARNNA